jgi:ankyrin repeat protein
VLALGAKPDLDGAYSPLAILLEKSARCPNDASVQASVRQALGILMDRKLLFKSDLDAKTREVLTATILGDLPRLQAAIRAGAPINAQDHNGWTPLMIALALGDKGCADWLLQQKAKVVMTTKSNQSPLWFAAMREQVDLVKAFLAQGADPNWPDENARHTSALYWAIRHKNYPLGLILIEGGAKGGPDILFETIRNGQTELAKAVLIRGAATDDAAPYENRGSVYWAVNYNRPEILKLLLEHGADPELKTNYNETPLTMAREANKALVPILEEAIRKKKSSGSAM